MESGNSDTPKKEAGTLDRIRISLVEKKTIDRSEMCSSESKCFMDSKNNHLFPGSRFLCGPKVRNRITFSVYSPKVNKPYSFQRLQSEG